MPLLALKSRTLAASLVAAVVATASCADRGKSDTPESSSTTNPPSTTSLVTDQWCARIPRPANASLERVPGVSDWFDVYQVEPGVFALVEARQFQETISYLIVGRASALLFDTGLGMVPIRPVVERLTSLPVRVLNSHTHYDHVGGNSEFANVLAMDTPYTAANQRGFAHAELAGEVAPEAFCGGAPAALDTASFHTRAWRATRRVADGDTLDLGGRVLQVVHVPGHTPDAVALLDRAGGALWTGDTYYDATVWLYVPETDLDAYERSIARLVQETADSTVLHPAHNTAIASGARLREMQRAIRRVRDGSEHGMDESGQRVTFRFDHFSILTSKPLLDGSTGDRTHGGSGLTTWP